MYQKLRTVNECEMEKKQPFWHFCSPWLLISLVTNWNAEISITFFINTETIRASWERARERAIEWHKKSATTKTSWKVEKLYRAHNPQYKDAPIYTNTCVCCTLQRKQKKKQTFSPVLFLYAHIIQFFAV